MATLHKLRDSRFAQIKRSSLAKIKVAMQRHGITIEELTEFLEHEDPLDVSPKVMLRARKQAPARVNRPRANATVAAKANTLAEPVKIATDWGTVKGGK